MDTPATTMGAALRAYLLCQPSDADALLRTPIRTLVAEEGGSFFMGSILVFDRSTQLYTEIKWPKSSGDLTALVAQTAKPVDRGGQDSLALLEMLHRVATRLYSLAQEESKTILAGSSLRKMTIGRGDEAEEVGDRYCVYSDPSGVDWTYTPHSLLTNLMRLQSSCIHQLWFQSIALKPEIGDDALP